MTREPVSVSYPRLKLSCVVMAVGLVAGLFGALLSGIMHLVQEAAFGHVNAYADPYASASAVRRAAWVLGAGVLATLSWWLLRRPARPLQGVNAMLAPGAFETSRPPYWRGVLNAVVQVCVVGAGASVGREVAPREVGALHAGFIGRWAGLRPEMLRIIVACGAAAGLAAVYHVPFAGAIYAVEVLLSAYSFQVAVIALATSGIATVVARLTVSTEPFYRVGEVPHDLPTLLTAVCVGALLAVPALGFRRATSWAEKHRFSGGRMLLCLPLAFLATAVVSMIFPQILGNGIAAVQWAFDAGSPDDGAAAGGGGSGVAGMGPVLAVFVLKALLVLMTLWCGAVGGDPRAWFFVGCFGWSCAWPHGPCAVA